MHRIPCPGCQASIRVPDDVLGQRAQCPFCRCHFRAPTRTADGNLSPATLIRRNPFAGSPTTGPGVVLLFVGLLACLGNAINVARVMIEREAFEGRVREDFDLLAERMNSPQIRDYVDLTVRWMPVAQFGFLAMSLVTIAGAVAMLRYRFHSLAMLGAVCALFNVANCCCVLGFPAGGWALYVLMNPDVRVRFHPITTQATSSHPSGSQR